MPDPYPKQRSLCLPVQPLLAGGRHELLGYFFPGSCSYMCNLWVSFIYFFLPVMLPSEIPKLPTDGLVRVFPGV